MRGLLAILFMGFGAVHAFANCVMLDTATWTQEQRGFLSHVAAMVAADTITAQLLTETSVEVCAPTADISGLNSAALQSAAQALLDAHAAANAARQAARDTADTEIRTNNLCTASLTQVDNRLDAIHTAIQADIDAIDATNTVAKIKTAMTTDNNRRTAVDKQIARCVLGRATLQGN